MKKEGDLNDIPAKMLSELEAVKKERDELTASLEEVRLNAGSPEHVYRITKAILAKLDADKTGEVE